MNDPLRRLRGTGQLVRQTMETLANQRLAERARILAEDQVKATDVLLAAHRICDGDTETVCTALLQAVLMTGKRMQPEHRRDLAMAVQALADELAAPTPDWLPKL